MSKKIKLCLLIIISSVLVACGGDGDDSGGTNIEIPSVCEIDTSTLGGCII